MPEPARCGAKTRSGGPCRHEAGWGTQHVGVGRCKLHGGAEPHAQVNGMVLLARREQQVMGAPLPITPEDAILECIRIAAGEVRYASDRIAELQADEAVGAPRRTLARKSDDGTVQEVRQDPPALHVWIVARREALDRLMAYSVAAVRAGIEKRRVKLAEDQGALLVQAIQGILRDLGVLDRAKAPGIIRKHLTLVAGAGS